MTDSSAEEGHDHLFKLLIIGDSGVGKSSLLSRFIRGKFKLDSKPTTTNNVVSRDVYVDGKVIKAQIVDIVGNHRFRSFDNDVQVKNACGVLIVYDVTNYSTFENVEKWYKELYQENSELEFMLIGNKCDLKIDMLTNFTEFGKEFADRTSIGFTETSAKDDRNVEKAFAELITRIFRKIINNVTINEIDALTSPKSISSEDMLISRRNREPAHYLLKIESFSLLSEVFETIVESDVFQACGHKWRLDLYPNGKKMAKNKYISLYVVLCDTKSPPKGWEVFVDVTFFVYDHTRHTYATFQDADGNRTKFNEKMNEWGFEKLISLESFKDSQNGYLLNDSCVFGVEVFLVQEFTIKDRCSTMIRPPTTMNTHTWKIDKFSVVTDDNLQSKIFKVGKLKWKLSLYPKGSSCGKGTHISFFLKVHGDSLYDNWRVYADFTLRIKSQNGNVDKERAIRRWFCPSSDNRGFPSFIELSELNDAANGFLLNDTLIVEVEISRLGLIKNFI